MWLFRAGWGVSQVFIRLYMFHCVVFVSYHGWFDYCVSTLWFYENPEENVPSSFVVLTSFQYRQ
jgi:hypothetical protein